MKPGISRKPVLFLLFYLLVPGLAYSAQFEPHTEASSTDFSLTDLNGKTQTLQDYRGKVVLVNFWASWCPPCIYEMPELQRLKNHFANRPFEILAINVGEKKYKVRKFTNVINLALPVLLDTSSEVFDQWGVKTLPTSFLIDADGKILYSVRGNPGWETEETKKTIEGMLP